MTLTLTDNAQSAAEKTGIQPQFVLEIEGVDTVYGAVRITKYIQVGDTGLTVGNDWVIGGLNEVADQADYISLGGTSTKITQQLMPDKGAVSSVSSVQVELIDKNNAITELISPGVVLDDILFARANLYMGFQGTAWPEDFVKIFAGFIDEIDSGPGNVKINIAHPDQKKRQKIFQQVKTTLNGAINNSTTTIVLTDASDLQFSYIGPDGAYDAAITNCIRIDDEVISYIGYLGNTLTGVTRGAFGTTAASHSNGAEVSSFHVLEEDAMTLALKLMISGNNAAFATHAVTSFDGSDDSMFFSGVDLEDEYNLQTGDFVTTTGATDSQNNQQKREIETITTDDTGTTLTFVAGVDYVDELASTATAAFWSQYDTLGDGLAMKPYEVDIEEHLRWRTLQLGSFNYKFYIRDTIDGKDFIEQEIYAPCGAYSLPRKARASVGYHIGPVPSVDIKYLNEDNIKNPSKIRLKRSTSRNFYNTVVYKYEEDIISEKFTSGLIVADADSQARIPYGNAVFTVESKGMRTTLDAAQNALIAARRRLGRYKFAAETLENVGVFFGTGFNIEPGDLVIVEFDNLQISNTQDGTRTKDSKFFEVTNKSLDLRTGDVTFTLVDTDYDSSERYGLVSPSSVIVSGSTTYAIIEDSYGAEFPGDEKRKWEDYIGLPVLVHSEDFTFSEEVTLSGFDSANPYKMLFASALSGSVQAGYIVDIPMYSTATDRTTNRLYKLVHAHMAPDISITGGTSSTVFTVGAGDASKFQVGFPIRVHSADFTDFSDEVNILSVVGTTITVDSTLGFTPSSSHYASLLGFADGDYCYRVI